MKYWNEKFFSPGNRALSSVSLGLSDTHFFHEIHTFINIMVTIHYVDSCAIKAGLFYKLYLWKAD
jgi:hypothetical protein